MIAAAAPYPPVPAFRAQSIVHGQKAGCTHSRTSADRHSVPVCLAARVGVSSGACANSGGRAHRCCRSRRRRGRRSAPPTHCTQLAAGKSSAPPTLPRVYPGCAWDSRRVLGRVYARFPRAITSSGRGCVVHAATSRRRQLYSQRRGESVPQCSIIVHLNKDRGKKNHRPSSPYRCL